MMNDQDHTTDPLNDAPILRSLKARPDPFVVPAGFFDRFPQALRSRPAKHQVAFDGIWMKRFALSIGVIAVILAVWWALPIADRYATDATGRELAIDVSPDELPLNESLYWELHTDPDQRLFEEVMIELDENELMAYLEHENVDVELLIQEP